MKSELNFGFIVFFLSIFLCLLLFFSFLNILNGINEKNHSLTGNVIKLDETKNESSITNETNINESEKINNTNETSFYNNETIEINKTIESSIKIGNYELKTTKPYLIYYTIFMTVFAMIFVVFIFLRALIANSLEHEEQEKNEFINYD